MATDPAVLQADLRDLLNALGMGDHARPQSPHEVFQGCVAEVRRRLARIEELEAALIAFMEEEFRVAQNHAQWIDGKRVFNEEIWERADPTSFALIKQGRDALRGSRQHQLAAAPDLLAALRTALKWMQTPRYRDAKTPLALAHQQIQAAIRKAEGRS